MLCHISAHGACAQLSCQCFSFLPTTRSFDLNIYVHKWFIKISGTSLPSRMLHTYCYNMPLHYTLTRWQSYRCSVLFLSKQRITPSQLDNASVNIDQTKVRRERRKRLPRSEEEERSGGFRRGSKYWHIFSTLVQTQTVWHTQKKTESRNDM